MLRATLVILLSMTLAAATTAFAQTRGTTTPSPTTTPAPAPASPSASTPQRGQRPATKPPAPAPMTLSKVVESLVTLKTSTRVEDLISKSGPVQFQATPANVELLKSLGASPKLISMIPPPVAPPPPPQPPAPKIGGPLTIVCEPQDCIVAVDDKY